MFDCCKPVIFPAGSPNSKDLQQHDESTKNLESSPSLPLSDVQMHRSRSESRILQRTPPPPPTQDEKGLVPSSARSLLEASAFRMATHEYNDKLKKSQPDTDHGGLPEKFLKAYEDALRQSNTKYGFLFDLSI